MAQDNFQTNSEQPASKTSVYEETSMGKSILYWLVVAVITIPVSFIVIGLIVRAALMAAA